MTLSDVTRPTTPPECTAEQILTGPRLAPKEYVEGYSADKFEEFIEEWAFFYLKEICGDYARVMNFGGAGDRGRDVIGYVTENNPVICDVYQCKHYKDALAPGDFYPELAKLCKHVYAKAIPRPRNLFVVAPKDVGPSLGDMLAPGGDILTPLKKRWQDASKGPLLTIGKDAVKLEGDFEKFVNDFDFSIVKPKPILEVINEFRQTHRFAQRFGGGLTKPLPATTVPASLLSSESRYIEQLIAVYIHDSGDTTINANSLLGSTTTTVSRHFNRSRERFFYAETIREFARESLPDGFEFSTIQDEVHDGVVEVAESEFSTAIERVNETTRTATCLVLGEHPLKPYLKVQSLSGICHQLANDDRLTWVRESGGKDG
ncbi:MAG: hypothetical protein KDB14_24635 [Planctomycetales bacterium]|nr:hypothetical protein [Planctomycetales bacterium]